MSNTPTPEGFTKCRYFVSKELSVEPSQKGDCMYVSITDEEERVEQFFLTQDQAQRLAALLLQACE